MTIKAECLTALLENIDDRQNTSLPFLLNPLFASQRWSGSPYYGLEVLAQ